MTERHRWAATVVLGVITLLLPVPICFEVGSTVVQNTGIGLMVVFAGLTAWVIPKVGYGRRDASFLRGTGIDPDA